MKNILIVGAGAVGGYFGAHLAKEHDSVSFLLRDGTRKAVQDHGLVIRTASGTFTVRPKVASKAQELPEPDLIILANKVYDLPEVLDQITPVVQPKTVILTLQNGVDIEDRVLARVQRDCVVGGVAFIYSRIVEPGVIDHFKRGMVTIGELMGNTSNRLEAIQELFSKAKIPCKISEDIRRTKWEKMCWNCVFNPLTVVINDRIARALDQPEMKNVIRGVVEEVMSVAAGSKVPLENDMPQKVVQWSEEIRDIHTSMYDDWKSGRSTEIDDLNGYIVRRGSELGIPTPLNEAFVAMVKVMISQGQARKNELVIQGDVIQPLHFDHQSLSKLSDEYHVQDIGSVMPGMEGKGIRLQGLLEVPALKVGVDHVTFHSKDDLFSASLTLQQAKEFGILLYEYNDGPFPEEKGGPYRLVTPGLGDLCANVKGVVRIELTKGKGKDTRSVMKGRN